ncbi:lysozyme P-like [Amphibalanus amphitrite]|uniref:lysozyme P-like n=1 Tax=Amphibalanus amphitrite TaxID=1232801 RepID=UPI001C9004AF|nr:lysozyme P-like [Amphibalanus amphitrite]
MARARCVLLGVLLCATLHQSTARQMDKCQLARELMRHGMPEHELADWLCLADHESRYDTGAVGRLNGDRTVDHGLFQISDLYWCDWSREEPQRSYRNLCRASCDDFRDDDITNDLACVRQIFDEHKRLQGNGFMAW